MLSPSADCAADTDSRSCHIARDCASDCATAASPIMPASSARASSASSRPCAWASPSLSESSSSTVQAQAGSGCGICGKCRATSDSACRPITSKPVSASPAWLRARRSSATQASSESQAASAVRVAAGCGCSFMTAAVITPSVPSLPM